MKNKIVVWGTNEQEEKVLIALELLPDDNKVMLYTFPEAIAEESFVNDMMEKWRTDKEEVAFPEGHQSTERELSMVESLLPDELKPERTDLILRAQTEWQFVVLSSKLNKVYEQELQEFREKVQQLGAYDNELFSSLKGFWGKVQEQARDRNLLREHADNLRDNINLLFEDLKKLRKKANEEFASASKGVYDEFASILDDIEKRIEEKGSRLNNIFEELKKLQRRYRESRMTNEHRSKLWERIDKAFKQAKERKFGPGVNEGSLADRHNKRLTGLTEAIQRMQNSIKRDEDDLKFEKRKIEKTEGQLEAQIRGAKIKMIEERITSKQEKLNEMLRTKDHVEGQIKKAEEKQAMIAQKEQERKQMLEAKEKAKQEIKEEAQKNKETAEAMASEDKEPGKEDAGKEPGEKTEKEQKQEAPESDSMLEAIGNVIGEAIDETITTAKAVAEVLGEAAEEAIENVVDQVELVAEAIENVEAEEKAQKEAVEEALEDQTDAKSEQESEPEETKAEAEEKPKAKSKTKEKEEEEPKPKAPKAKTKTKEVPPAESEPEALKEEENKED